MKILLHICCAPCTIYPLETLRKETGSIEGLFFNPNIHPYLEYRKRLEALREYAVREGLAVEEAEDYPMEDFLRKTSFMGPDRCSYCYEVRLRRTAAHARKGRFDAFTTTLLFSRYQKHELLRRTGEAISLEMGVPFYYQDFRVGWEEKNRRSRESGMYRQKYCGCIFSEKERFYKGK